MGEGPEAYMARSSTYRDDWTPGGMTLTRLLMAIRKRVVLNTLPWGNTFVLGERMGNRGTNSNAEGTV